MRKSYLLISLVVLILLIGGVVYFNDQNVNSTKEKVDNLELVREERVIESETGDYVLIPSSDAIEVDSEEEIIFYNNLLNVYLTSEVSESEANELAEMVDGTVVGKLQGSINLLQIKVEKSTYDELMELTQRYHDHDLVEFAHISIPLFISDLSHRNQKTSGDHWWVEAIQADKAWEFIDQNRDQFEEVKIAVLERGRLGEGDHHIEDKDLSNSVIADNTDGSNFWVDKDENIIYSHPRWVTKFIVSDPDENPHNFRGVAHGIGNVYFKGFGAQVKREEDLANEDTLEDVTESYIYFLLKNSLEKGAKIINNSWGFPPDSEKKWGDPKLFKSYDAYVNSVKNSNNAVSAQIIIVLDRLLAEGNNDFLIVQAAGNGLARYVDSENSENDEEWTKETATEAVNTGVFANINKSTYDKAKRLSENLQLSLEEIRHHIIVVGGAEPKRNGKYHAPEWASYGDAIDLAAPASKLRVDSAKKDDPKQAELRGTSFATPMVSGAAALVWSYHPNLTAKEVKSLLIQSSIDKVMDERDDQTYIYPLLNATAFLTGESVYKELIERYKTAIEEKWGPEKLLKASIHVMDDVSIDHLLDTYGYEIRDLNLDGIPELIIGDYWENNKPEIYEIYTIKNSKPERIFANGIRTKVEIYKDGTISESYGDRYLGYYKLKENGEKQLVNGFQMNDRLQYETLSEPKKIMTKEDIRKLDKQYENIKINKHLFKPFVLKKNLSN